jgi:hypothetical protein
MSNTKREKQSKIALAQDERTRAIERVRRRIASGGRPRLLVSFLLALTGAAGFLVSTALLHLGVTLMTVRYPLAVLSAYTVFLLLLRLWLAFQRRQTRRRGNSALDWLPDQIGDSIIPQFFDSAARVPPDAPTFGGGADFGGGGTGGSWTGGSPVSSDVGGGSSIMDSVPDVPDVGFDFGEGCFWIIIPIVAICGVVAAMFYVVYVAPIFLAEILVDALLLAGLYKRLKSIESPRHWLRAVVGRTLLPVLIATALFIAAGYLMQRIAPEAESIGGFWREINTPKDRR